MNRLFLRFTGAAIGFAAVATAASAQMVACPPGYGYSYGYGCVPAAPVYAAPVVVAPPVYDPYGLAFGFGPDRYHHDHGRYEHGYGHDNHGHDDHGHHH